MSKPVALITGGSSGIGLGIARRLIERDCHVVLSARGRDRLDQLTEELGARGVAADVSTEDGRASLVAEIRRLGRLDWLVNNAGAGGGTAGLDVDVARARRVLEPNFYAHVALTHELWPLLREYVHNLRVDLRITRPGQRDVRRVLRAGVIASA